MKPGKASELQEVLITLIVNSLADWETSLVREILFAAPKTPSGGEEDRAKFFCVPRKFSTTNEFVDAGHGLGHDVLPASRSRRISHDSCGH